MDLQKTDELLTWKAPGIITPFGTHYILEGNADRPLVLCIHGIGSYYFYFDGLAKALLAAGYRVLRYDLIGRGFSEPADTYDRAAHLRQIRDLLQHLGLSTTPRHVIGHSMGGALALLHADEDAEHISSLTLLAPAGLMDGAIFAFLRSCTCLHGPISSFLRSGQVQNEMRSTFKPQSENCSRRILFLQNRPPEQKIKRMRCPPQKGTRSAQTGCAQSACNEHLHKRVCTRAGARSLLPAFPHPSRVAARSSASCVERIRIRPRRSLSLSLSLSRC